MNRYVIGEKLKAARKAYGYTQASLATATGLTQSRISKLERGEFYPTSDEMARLRTFMELSKVTHLPPPSLPAPSNIWRVRPPRRANPSERPFSSRLYSASKAWGHVVDRRMWGVRSRADHHLAQQFLELAGLDSSLEALFWITLLHAGARPCSWAISKTGFNAHRVVDLKTKLTLTHAPHPCLETELGSMKALLFPQVCLDVRNAYYRLDALVCLRCPADRIWLNLEIDGRGHDPIFDDQRQERLGLPTLRLATDDVVHLDAITILEAKLAELLGKRAAGARLRLE